MELAARAGVCMTSKEVLAIIETCTGQTLMMVEQNRSIVGRERADYVFVTRPKLERTYGVAKMSQRGADDLRGQFRHQTLGAGSDPCYGTIRWGWAAEDRHTRRVIRSSAFFCSLPKPVLP